MLGYTLFKNSSALICTSDFKHEALIVDKSNGTILDCGASSHFTPEHLKLLNYREINPEPICSADGHTFSATGKGDLKLELPNGNQKPTPVTLKNVYYLPHLAFTLMSVGTMDWNGYNLCIKEGKCVIWSPKSNVIGQIPLIHGLYRITTPSNPHTLAVASTTVKKMSISELHRKMGHVNYDDLRKMVRDGMVTGIKLDFDSKPEFCEACIKAKAFRKPFAKKSETMYCNYGDKVVVDTWGPAPVESLGYKKYFQLYQDLSSHEERVYFNCEKSEGFNNYKKYEAWVWVQCNAVIKIFGSDWGGEFRSKAFDKHLEYAGIVRHLTVHDSPVSNRAAERANRTHMECTHAMILASGLSSNLWAEAVLHSVWIQNHIPTCSLDENKTPHEKGTRKKPDLLYLY
jgi:GAG-pre-integrase domain